MAIKVVDYEGRGGLDNETVKTSEFFNDYPVLNYFVQHPTYSDHNGQTHRVQHIIKPLFTQW